MTESIPTDLPSSQKYQDDLDTLVSMSPVAIRKRIEAFLLPPYMGSLFLAPEPAPEGESE